MMGTKGLIKYWLKGSSEALKVAKDLNGLNHRSYALFFCHLCLEKALKAILAKKFPEQGFYFHSLSKLATLGRLDLPDGWLELLDEISTFNIKARYNDIKYELYKRATPTYSKYFLEKTEEIKLWLEKQITKI